MMRRLLWGISFTLILAPLPSYAWFFFFLPGSVTGAIADAVTGSEGANCVPASARVDDRIKLPDGSIGQVKSLSGTSSRCTVPRMPIRALLVPVSADVQQPKPVVTGPSLAALGLEKLSIEFPDSYKRWSISDSLKSEGVILDARDEKAEISVQVSVASHSGLSDMLAYARNLRAHAQADLIEGKSSEIESFVIGGNPAFRFETSGGLRSNSAYSFTHVYTVIEGSNQLVIINAWTSVQNYASQKFEIQQLATRVQGVPSVHIVAEKPAPVVGATATASVALVPSPQPVVAPATAPIVAPVVSTQRQSLTVADKLRELNALYKENLINQKDFETKKQEILKGL